VLTLRFAGESDEEFWTRAERAGRMAKLLVDSCLGNALPRGCLAAQAGSANTELSPDRANSLILQAHEGGIIGARLLPDVIQQWRQTNHPEFKERRGRHGAS